MKLSHLRDVLAVAEHGSLRAASRHLKIAQPVITRSIRDTEQELGAALFERHTKGVRLTLAGEAFVRHAEVVQTEFRKASDAVHQLKGREAGGMAIGFSTASIMAIMPIVVPNFRRRYPNAVLKVSESLFQPIEADLLAGRIDLYVGPLDPGLSNRQFEVEKLFANRRFVMARRGHPLANATSLKELTGAQWIRPTLSTRSTDVDLDDIFHGLDLPDPQIVLHARSALVTLIALMGTDLLTVIPEQWLSFSVTNPHVTALRLTEQLNAPPMCIVRRRDLPLTPMAEYMCDLVRRAGTDYAFRQRDQWA